MITERITKIHIISVDIDDTKICAQSRGGRTAACQGDSGGPMPIQIQGDDKECNKYSTSSGASHIDHLICRAISLDRNCLIRIQMCSPGYPGSLHQSYGI